MGGDFGGLVNDDAKITQNLKKYSQSFRNDWLYLIIHIRW